jgi:cell division protein FtsA
VIAAGLVLTGGSSRMEGAIELAEEIFHVPVRLGVPQQVRGLAEAIQSPVFSTAVGLLLYARENMAPVRGGALLGGRMGGIFDRIRNWFQGRF